MSARHRPGPASHGNDLLAAGAVLLLSLALHAVVGYQYRGDPFYTTYVSDALSYHQWAEGISEHGVAAQPVFHQAPLFPLVLGGVYHLAGDADPSTAALLLQVLLTSVAVTLLVPLGRLALHSTAAGVAAALLVLLHGPFVFHSFKLLPVPLALATQAAGLVLLSRARERPSIPATVLAGVAWGLAFITRSETVLVLPFLLAALRPSAVARTHGGRPRGWGGPALLLAAAAIVILPVTLHNLHRGDLVPIAASAGENLFVGNQRGADGGHRPLHPKAGDLFSQRSMAEIVAEQARGRQLRPSEISRYWLARAAQEVVAAPGAWLRLELLKLGRILHPGDPTDMYSFALERSHFLPALYLLPFPAWGLWVLGGMGLVTVLRRDDSDAHPLAALLAVHFVVLLAFFVSTRLRLPLLFCLAPFAGVTIVERVRSWKAGRGRAVTAALAITVVVLSAAGLALSRASARETLRLASVLSIQKRFDDSLSVLQPLLDGPQADPLALDTAGSVLYKQGRYRASREHYLRALALGLPGSREAGTRTRLGWTYEKLGQPALARAEHDAAVESGHADAGTYYERGMFRLRHNDAAGAVEDLRRAVDLDPQWPAPQQVLRSLRAP